MKKFLLLISVSLIASASYSQETYIKKKPTLSVNFMLNDYRTAELLKNDAPLTVIKNKAWSDISEMSPGLSLGYFQGLSKHIDLWVHWAVHLLSIILRSKQIQ